MTFMFMMNPFGFDIETTSGLRLAAGVLLLLLVSCGEKKVTDHGHRKTFPVVPATVMDVPHDQEYVANIQNSNFIELRARVNGYLESISVDEGQHVAEGQLLFTISSQGYQEELKRANTRLKSMQAEARMAEIDLKNAQLLLEKKIISQSELDFSSAKLDSIKAKVEEARTEVSAAARKLTYAEIRAPFSGVINRFAHKAGSLVSENELLTSLSNDGDVFAYFNMSESEYLELMEGDDPAKQKNVVLELANGQMYSRHGEIETCDNVFSKSTGNIAFRARFPNPEHLLKHGSTGKVIVQSKLKNALVIPQKCTFEVQHKTCVFMLGKDNTVHLRSIATKLRLPNHYVIDSGLSPSDRIIFEGIQVVREGEVIAPDVKPLKVVAPL